MEYQFSLIKESCKTYPKDLLRHLWAIVITGVGGLMGLLTAIFPNVQIPSWVWVFILVLGLMIAQFLAWHTIRLERDRLRKYNVTQDHLLVLGEYRSKLITHQNKTLNSATELGKWIEQFNTLKAEASKYIADNISPAEAKLFDRYGVFTTYLTGGELQIGGEISKEHVQKKINDY